MKFKALNSLASGEIVQGKIYEGRWTTGSYASHPPTQLRIQVRNEHGKLQTYNPVIFQPTREQ